MDEEGENFKDMVLAPEDGASPDYPTLLQTML
jgi:hypothetical protein